MKLQTCRVPCADTCYFSEATVRLSHEPGATPPCNDTVVSVPFCCTDDVEHLVLAKDIGDFHLLLEETCDIVHLLLYSATINLNFLDVGLLHTKLHLADLSMADGT